MIEMAQWIRIWVFSMEVPGSSSGKIFHAPFPCSDYSIRVFQPHNLQLFGFCLVTL